MNTETRSRSKLLILIDGSSYLYRAFHALPPLANSRGEPTGAVYGVINMIRKLLKDYQPEYVGVVFDPKGKTQRDEIYTAYKAHRPPMPSDLVYQVQMLHEVIKAMGLPLIVIEGVEADDVIGTLAVQAAKEGQEVLISTGDKDIAQLINDHITLINTMSGFILNKDTVKEKFGVSPAQMIEYFALIGDSVDNIPGIPKVGPKTAVKWLNDYKTLDNLMAHADEITGKVGENLRANLDQLSLSKKLVTIYTDIPLTLTYKDLKITEPNHKKLIELFKQLEFRSWLAELLQQEETVDSQNIHYHTILDKKEFQTWTSRLEKTKQFSFDTETNSLDPIKAELIGVSFAIKPNEAAYVPVAHNYPDAPRQLDRDFVLSQLKPLLEDKTKTIIGQNLKYDTCVLAKYNVAINFNIFDTMLESYVLNSASNRHDLYGLSLKYLGKQTITYEDIAGKGAKQIPFPEISIEKASQYAAKDADMALQLHHMLWPKIQEQSGLQHIFTNIEIPLIPVLARMEQTGVLIDPLLLEQQSREITARLKELEEDAYRMAGEMFNLGSPKQLQTILFEKLKLPVIAKTPTGQAATSESVLQELALNYPLPKILLEHRSLSKIKSTYTDRLPLQIYSKTGRVHTNYNQAVTSTGRLSSTDPNLQNIPTRHEEGRRIRKAFIATPGYKMVAADYSQIELRIMAHLTQDKGLLTAFEKELDIHRATASEVFNVAFEAVTTQQRRSAKAINFGLIYGMSAFGLSKQLGVERDVAQQYMDMYFNRYPAIKDYMDKTRNLAHRQGFVETLFGRRLYIPEINATNLQRRRAAERAAINGPLQGTAADIIKIAMIDVDRWIIENKIDARMIMQVHDELVFEVAENSIDIVVPTIRSFMCNATKLSVPIDVDIGIGNNWDEAH